MYPAFFAVVSFTAVLRVRKTLELVTFACACITERVMENRLCHTWMMILPSSKSPQEGNLPPPRVVFVQGPPGVGKARLTDALIEACVAAGRYILTTSFNAINAPPEMGSYTVAHLTELNYCIHSFPSSCHHTWTFAEQQWRGHIHAHMMHTFSFPAEVVNDVPIKLLPPLLGG